MKPDGGDLARARSTILSSGGAQARLCSACVDVLPVTGAAVSLLAGEMNQVTLCASDPVAERLDELQFDLGEGPCWQASDTGLPVLVPDVREGQNLSWPLFGAAIQETSAVAIFAFPLRVGSIGVGALDLYRDQPGPLSAPAMQDAFALAEALSWAVLRRLLEDGPPDSEEGLPERYGRRHAGSRREIYQATGMVLAQLSTTAEGAFALLRARAFAEGRSVAALARDVIARRVRFDEPTGGER